MNRVLKALLIFLCATILLTLTALAASMVHALVLFVGETFGLEADVSIVAGVLLVLLTGSWIYSKE
jgi:uncharacterized membrane protein YphA (DoxX/SURF4 family)